MMNYPGVISKDEEVLSKLLAAGDRPKDGHAPLLSGKSLNAYVIAGLGSDHECSNLDEAKEKLRKGMHVMIREGTQEKNLQSLIPVINEFNSFNVSLVSDDVDPVDLNEKGHLDYLIRRAISYGIDPIRAIQMTTINTARYFGLMNQGAIAPGFIADFILLDDLTLEDMLKIILYSSQSMFTIVPMLYHINYNNKEILFIQTGMVGGVVVHYIIQEAKPDKKFIKLNKLSGHFSG